MYMLVCVIGKYNETQKTWQQNKSTQFNNSFRIFMGFDARIYDGRWNS